MKVSDLSIPEGLKQKYIEEGITELNPPQRQAVEKGLMDGEDLIVASPTASGKTLIAELAVAKEAVEKGKTAIYIVPLKALASEKYEDFSERYENLNVKMSVGNSDDAGEYLDSADIVIVTSEKMDSMLRHNPSWIHDIGLVVVDEIHLLTSENRGPTLEVTLTRLRELLDFQLLGLSATISNASEMADWLEASLVKSDYRPVELKHGVYWNSEVEFYSDEDVESKSELETPEGWSTGADVKKREEEASESEKEEMGYGEDRGTENILRDTLEMDKQAITFCNSRKGSEKESDRAAKIVEDDLSRDEKKKLEEYSEEILNALGSPTSQCKRLAKNVKNGAAFHHAGLVSQQRKAVEEAFKKGLIRNISATPTLAAGVNLPAFRVVIRDLKRYTGNGMDFIPVLEYEQMTGRAGRPSYDDRGEAISIAKQPGMKQDILERYILGEAERIQSKLNVEPVLRMHTLALIASKFCSNMDDLLDFYKETFYAHQFGDMMSVREKIERVVDTLESYGFVDKEEFEATEIGRKVSDLYIDPDSAHLIIQGLEKASGTETRDISYLFLLSRTSEIRSLNVKDKEWNEYEKMLMDAEPYLLEDIPQEWDVEYETFMDSMKTAMMMNAWISEMDEEEIMNEFGTAPGGIRAKIQNADWLLYSSKELARMKGLEVDNELEKLRIRLKHGIDEELLGLVKYDQIGRVRARKLYDHGIRSKKDIKQVNFEKLKKLIGKKTAGLLKEQVGEENYFDRENIMDYFS
ncbi:MAG: DEAD/DEAH box helicase [Candidatus Nanohaloarchaea archaeon]